MILFQNIETPSNPTQKKYLIIADDENKLLIKKSTQRIEKLLSEEIETEKKVKTDKIVREYPLKEKNDLDKMRLTLNRETFWVSLEPDADFAPGCVERTQVSGIREEAR